MTMILPHFRTTVPSSVPAPLYPCPKGAALGHCQPPMTSAAPKNALHGGTSSISLARGDGQTSGSLDSAPSSCRSYTSCSVPKRALTFLCHLLPVGKGTLFPCHQLGAKISLHNTYVEDPEWWCTQRSFQITRVVG